MKFFVRLVACPLRNRLNFLTSDVKQSQNGGLHEVKWSELNLHQNKQTCVGQHLSLETALKHVLKHKISIFSRFVAKLREMVVIFHVDLPSFLLRVSCIRW